MLTLNQAIEIFDQCTFKHKALGKNLSRNNFGFGDSWEALLESGATYPFCWVSKLPTTYGKSGLVIRKFLVDISDKVNLGESNERHVLSDTESICIDFINYIEQALDGLNIAANIGEVSEITDYTEKRDDQVSGNSFTIEIRSHAENSSCNLPIYAGDVFRGNYIYLSGTSTGTGCNPVLIKDQDGNTLQTFVNGGTYTVTLVSEIDGGNATTVFTNTVIGN